MTVAFSDAIQDNENMQPIAFIYLNSHSYCMRENLEPGEQLRRHFYPLKIYYDDEECERYIRSVSKGNRIVLVATGSIGENIVPRIVQLRQISSIYIHCLNIERHKLWSKQFTKVIPSLTCYILHILMIFLGESCRCSLQ
jgi:hypothetical protein